MNGYMGRILWVDLTTGEVDQTPLDEDLCAKLIGGYGIGARLLLDRIPAGADPLGPDNMLGFLTGPYTGSGAFVSSRYVVVGKSPLTGGWGDANSGGHFAPALKGAGVDAVFFTGQAANPVYLLVEDGQAQLCDATDAWGMDTHEADTWFKAKHGKDVRAAMIGPAGEKLIRFAAVINDGGRAAGRSGLGAVMGSKKLKAVVARGKAKAPIAHPERLKELRKQANQGVKDGVGGSAFLLATGTPGATVPSVDCGDAPIRNWRGSVTLDYQHPKEFEYENQEQVIKRKWACYGCPIGCGRHVSIDQGEYAGVSGHIPEYETQAMFGSNLLNYNYRSVVRANEICNAQGLDTIATGATVAFAIECYEAGIITDTDTDGLKLDWGDHKAIVALTEMIAERRAIGDVLAEGPAIAAERIGNGADAFAMHAGGEPLPAHDPRFEPAMAAIYKVNATPGRHTQACQYSMAPNHPLTEKRDYGVEPTEQATRGRYIRPATAICHIYNCSGTCMFTYGSSLLSMLIDQLNAITGNDWTFDDLVTIGERIETVRQAFNWKHGKRPMETHIPDRVLGRPPLPGGPTAGMTIDIDTIVADYFKAMGWDPDTGRPSLERLRELDIEDLAPAFE